MHSFCGICRVGHLLMSWHVEGSQSPCVLHHTCAHPGAQRQPLGLVFSMLIMSADPVVVAGVEGRCRWQGRALVAFSEQGRLLACLGGLVTLSFSL